MNLDNDEDIWKAINAGGGANMDVDDELAALEAEISGGPKKGKKKKKGGDDLSLSDLSDEEEKKPAQQHNKKNSDDDLAALEKEGLDDLDDDEEEKPKPKPQKKPEQKPQPPAKPKVQPPPQQKPVKPPSQPPQNFKKELEKEMQKKQSGSASSGIDLYPEKTEKKYHDVEKMVSLGVLQKENEICDKIIEYKKKKNLDYDTWDFKKESIKDKIDIVTSTIQDGIWDFETYKKKIKDQYAWESKLLVFVDKDPSLNNDQKNTLKGRVNDRKKIIEEELTRNPEEEAAEEEEEAKPQPQQQAQPQPQIQKKESNKPVNQAAKGTDFYPEVVENKYHSVAKMESLGVLEKEKEICDLIIEYKKKKGEDYDTWDFKKESIDTRKDTITSSIQNGIMDFEGYKKKIKNQYQWETKLLTFVDKDPNLNDAQKKILKERINKRKKIIEEELTKNPDEEAEAEEKESPKEVAKPKEAEAKKKKEELVTKKSLNPMFNVSKDKEADEIKRLTQVVTDRLNEYRAAIDYFKSNELSEQQTKAIKSAKDICIELKKIQDGKWREVNEFKLPDPVTPEYIYGYSKEERQKKFAVIVSEYKKQRTGVQNDMKARVEAFKKLKPAQFKKIEAVAKKDLDALKTKAEKYTKVIKLLEEKYQDKWVPSPLYIETEEEISVEKVNKEIPENVIKIFFGATTYKKNDRLYLIVTIPELKLEKTFNQKAPGDWTQEIEWKVGDSTNFKKLYNTGIHVDVYEKKTIIKDKFRGSFDMEPRGLKEHNEYSNTFKMNMDDKKGDYTVDVLFKTRVACKVKEMTTETKTLFQVTKIFPPFNIRGGNNTQQAIKLDVQSQKVTHDDLKVNSSVSNKAPTKTPTPAQKPRANVPKAAPHGAPHGAAGAPTKKAGPPKEIIDKSEFREEELIDPDNVNSLNTLQVLEFKLNKYEEIRNKIDGRTPRELMQRIVKIKCKLQNLNDSLGDDIGPEDYLVLLRTTFAHDKRLADYFNQQKDTEKSKLVTERLPLILKETEELMKQMPK